MATAGSAPKGVPNQRSLPELLKDIIRFPDADDLRLKYADAWERRGRDIDRARLIRIQVQLANLPEGVDHPEWLRLSSQAENLLFRKAASWIPRWYEKRGIIRIKFHRGFVECVTIGLECLSNRHLRNRLFSSAPIRHLNIVGIDQEGQFIEVFEVLAGTDEFGSLLSLNLDSQNLGDKAVTAIVESAPKNLQWLSLAYNKIDFAGVRELARATQYGNLRRLIYVNLQGNPYDPVEKVYEDQGIVVGTEMPKASQGLSQVDWMKRKIVEGRILEIDRFSLRAADNATAA